MSYKRLSLLAVILILASLLSGCGGDISSPAVSVKASATSVDGADVITLTATVSNDKGTGGVAWSVSGGGTLSNTTTTSATYTAPAATTSAQTVTVLATSVADTTKTGSVTLTIPAKPAITPPSSAQLTGAVGAAYSLQLAGTGGIAPYTWTLTGGTLPTGWTLTTGGLLSGPAPVAGQAGTIDLTFTATDSGTPTALAATLQLTVTIAPAPAITFTGAVPGSVTYNAAYGGSAAASGGAGALVYGLASGSGPLPTGLGVNANTGAITGTATAAGTYPFTIRAADAYGDAATQPYTITVNPATPTLAFTAIPTHTFGDAAFSASATSASGGAVTYSVTSGPATINSSTGLVTLTGADTVVLGASQAAATNYTVATASVSFTVNKAAATINVTPYTATYDGAAHTATGTVTGVGGVSLPAADLTLTGTTHTNAGTYSTDAWSFTDASGNYANASGTVSDKINQAAATINVTAYTVAYDGATHTATATVTGLDGVNLAAGLTLSSTTHTNAGTYASDTWSFADAGGNYSSASGTVSDKIDQATAIVNVTPYTVVYDGNAHVAEATATGVGGVSLSASDFTLTGTAHTNAGTYTNDAWSFADPNYISQSGTVSDKVNQATATITVLQYSVTYDGNAHTAPATATGVGNVNLTADLNVTGTTHTNAGSYPADAWSFTDPLGNYISANGTVSDTINKSSPAVVMVYIPDHTYGDPNFAITANSPSDGVVTYTVDGGPATINNSTGMVTLTGAGDVRMTAHQAASTNYNASDSAQANFHVNPATPVVSVTPYNVAYDGAPHTASATATGVGGVTLSPTGFTMTGTTHTNAGNYTTDAWSFSDASGNYNSASGTVTDKISQAAATINVTPYTAAYDATAHTATATATGIGGVNLIAGLTLSGTTHTNAGNYTTDAWSFTDASGNYANANGTVSDKINQVTAIVNVTPYTVVYDGNAHVAGATATGVGGVSLSASDFTLTGTAHTNAGSYTNDAWTFADANYISQSGTVSDKINQATAVVNVTPYIVTYDGNAHTAAAAATGVGNVNLIADLNVTGTTHTNAGSYPADAWSFTDPLGNYISANGTVSDTINKSSPAVHMVYIPDHTYGDPNFTVSANSPSDGVVTYTIDSGPATINSSTGMVTLTGAGMVGVTAHQAASTNYNASDSAQAPFYVNRATPVVNVTPYNLTYDGAPHTASAAATGVGGVTLSPTGFTMTGTTHTNAGNYTTDAWSFSDASGNYNSASGTVTDKINQALATINVTPYTVTYDATAHTATGTATGLAGVNLAAGLTLSSTTHTNAGSYTTDAWSFTDASGNYANQSGTVSDTISKAAATVNVTPYTVTYDGSVHTATATATGVGSVSLSASDFTLTGTAHTNAGTYASDAWSFADTNYVSQSGTISDTINMASATVVMASVADHTFGDQNFTVTATATSNGAVTFYVSWGPATVNPSTGVVTLTGAGHVAMYASVAATTNYSAATSANVDFNVNPATATIHVTPYNVTYDGAPHTASAAATGVGGVSLSPTDFTMGGTTHTNAGSYAGDAWSFADLSGNYNSASGTVTDTINAAAPGLSFTSIATRVFGTPPAGDAPFTVSASDSVSTPSSGAISYSVTSGPATISGNTVTLTGSGMVTLVASQVASGNYASATTSISFQVNPTLSITTTTLPTGAVGVPYSQQLQATGGAGAYMWATDDNGKASLLALGLSLSSSGIISGSTPIAGGPASITFEIIDNTDNLQASHHAWATVSVTVTAITITTTTLPAANTGSAYSQQLTSSGGAGGNVWTVSGASNLATYGLTLSTSGLLSGTIPSNVPTGMSVVTFTAQVKDSSNVPATKLLTIAVYNPLTFTTTSLSSAIYNSDYSAAIVVTGGSGSYTWSVNSASIPATGAATALTSGGGLTGANDGSGTLTIAGIPASYGTITLVVQVTDANTGFSASKTYTITVASLKVTIDPNSVPQGMVNMPYTFGNVNIQNGTGPYTVTYTNAPEGLAGDSNNSLVGTPTSAGTKTVTVKVTDNSTPTHQIGNATFNLTVVPETVGTDNSKLNGQYACYLDRFWDGGVTGGDGTSTLYQGGAVFAFTASGGTISDGKGDFNSPVRGYKQKTGLTGTYAIDSDNRGYINIGSGSLLLSVAGANLSSNIFQELALTEMDDAGSSPSNQSSAGHCYKQVTTALSGIRPSGATVFGLHGESAQGYPESVVGQTVFSGSNANAVQDVVTGTGAPTHMTTSNTTGTTDSYGRMTTLDSGSVNTVFYLTNDSRGDTLIMTTNDHNGTSHADFMIGQARAQSSSSIEAGYPISGNAVMYLSGAVSTSGSSPTYKAMAMQLSGGTSAKQITVNSIAKNNAGTFSLDTDDMYGQTVSYTTDTSTGRTTLSGATGDYLYLYDTNAAVVLFADTGNSGGRQNLIGWLEPQTTSGSWSLSDVASSAMMYKQPNGDHNSDLNDGVLTTASDGTISNFAQDSGGSYWASWDEPLSGTVGVSATGVLALNSTDGASYGVFDINMTSGGSTSTQVECYAISVNAAVKPTTKAKLVCIDTSSHSSSLTILQE